jgi:outer membrane protein OmpA-like peptidoglycan-associated protein
VGGSFELTLPNGPTHKGFGTDEMSFTPSVSTRYQRGLVALGANVGYQIYTGDQRPVVNGNDFQAVDIFHYGAEVIVRASDTVALRTEVAGRIWSQNGDRWNDSVLLPGIDVNISDALTFRPTGWVGLTSTALDWGIGAGLALQFPMPKLAAAPPPPPSPTPAAETPPPAKEKIILRGVKFDFNKATLRPDALPILDQAAEALKEHGAINVTVEGYTDNIGSEVYNQRLSERRATAVRDYLAAHGVAAARMTVVGRGQADPVASNDTEDGRAQNRRVELRVTE